MDVEKLRGGWYSVAAAKWAFVEHFDGDKEVARIAWGFANIRLRGGEVAGGDIRRALTGAELLSEDQ